MTAETAVVLPGVAVVVAALLACGSVVSAQVRCLDAARAGARAAARGDGVDAVRATALRRAPDGASVAVSADATLVRVRVVAAVRLPALGTVEARAEAVADPEPTTAAGPGGPAAQGFP